jgi:peptide/nickel transport system substrate-binding protein
MPRHIWENVDQPEKFTDPKAVIGTGPYKLVDYSREHGTYLYEAYDNYYLGKPEIEQVKFVKVNEEMIPAALKNGSVNAGDIPPELVTDMEANGFTVLRCPYGWNAKLMINHRKEPLSRKEFRQALAYAIDREELVQITQRGYALAGSPGMVPSDSPWFCPDVEQYKYNPEKAKELLEGLGYKLENGYFVKDGEELILQLIAPPSLGFKDVGEFIKGQLEGIGIKVNFTTLEASTLDAKVLNWQFDLAIYGHGGLFEPSILNRVILGEGFNSARYHENQTLNQLLEAQLREMNPEKRKDLVCQIQQIYAEEIPALTLYYPDWYWAHDGSIELYYTQGGVASGIPIALNKMAFLR